MDRTGRGVDEVSAQVDHRASEAGDEGRHQDGVLAGDVTAGDGPTDDAAADVDVPADDPIAEPAEDGSAVAEPAVVEPAVVGSAAVGSAEDGSAVAESAVVEPAVIEPAVIEPTVIEPTVIEPTAVGPAVVESAADGPVDDAADGPDSTPVVVQDAPAASPAALRVDFGAHLEANYQRLVAQLYAITLDPGEAHDVVQDAYSRAWRRWAEIRVGPDPTGWVRRVAVRSTQRGWRRVLERVGLSRPRPVGDGDPRTAALLAALGRLAIAERRVVVLFHMVGMSRREIAALEQVAVETVAHRLRRAHQAVTEGMADELPSVLGVPAAYDDPYTPHAGAERQYRWTP